MVKRKCIRGGANYWLNKSRIWLPWNKSLTGGRLFGVSFYKGKFKDWTKRGGKLIGAAYWKDKSGKFKYEDVYNNDWTKSGGNLRRRVYKRMKRGKGYTREDLVGITADGRQIY